MTKKISVFLTGVLFSLLSIGQSAVRVLSPDKAIQVTIHQASGQITYSVSRNGKPVIEPSVLVIELEKANFSTNTFFLSRSAIIFSTGIL